MRLKIIRQTVALKRVVRVGEVIEVQPPQGRILLTGNKAIEVPDDTPLIGGAAEKARAKPAGRKATASGATGAAGAIGATGATGATGAVQPGATGAAQPE